MYRILLERCVQAFKISDVVLNSDRPCHGDPGGDRCRCHWQTGDFGISINTPQQRASNELLQHHSDMLVWLKWGRYFSRTKGVMWVTRIVPPSAPHLEWVDPKLLSDCFKLSASAAQIDAATASLRNLTTSDTWFASELRHDGQYDFIPEQKTSVRSVRSTTFFRTTKASITVGQSLDRFGIRVFDRPPAYCLPGSPPLEGNRCEVLVYEFELSGKNSWNYSVA